MSIPERIGRYQIVGHLATGGMAEILLGKLQGPAGFQRPVVLKRVLPHLARKREFRAMFLDEARIVAGIRHPNVVQVHELGVEDPELFLVMEYLEGESLSGLVKRLDRRGGHLDFAVVAHLGAEACAGLHAAHEYEDDRGVKQNLVHRDVSPQNLFVTYEGAVKVLDFGIAKAADRYTNTSTGQMKGKFSYMAPEQCRAEPLDRRADVFAMGIVLWEVSTGRRLFERDNQLLVLKAITEEPIARVSEVVPDCPPELDAVIARALARDREARFATCADMRRELLAVRRRLDPEGIPQERLAEAMQDLFVDRVAQKHEMLRQVEKGSTEVLVPAADVDSASFPDPLRGQPTEAEGTLASQEAPAPGRHRARRALWAGVAAILLLLGVGAGWRAVRGGGDEAGADEPSVARGPLAPATASERAAAAEPAAPPVFVPLPAVEIGAHDRTAIDGEADDDAAMDGEAGVEIARAAPGAGDRDHVVLHVETRPPGAWVRVDGQIRGRTPLDVEVPRGSSPLAVLIGLTGYRPVTEEIVPDADQRLQRSLRRRWRRPGKSGGATAMDDFFRFE